MEIVIQALDTINGTIEYITNELKKCTYLVPGGTGRINLSLDLTKPEDITVCKHQDKNGTYLSCSWNVQKKHFVYGDIPCDPDKLFDKVCYMYNDVANKLQEKTEKEAFEDRCYKLYQLEWMMSHGYSLDDLYKVMLKYEKEMFDPEDFSDGEYGHGHDFDKSDLERAAEQARDIFLYQEGFGGSQIFASKEEFLDAEYQDVAYMKWLFETQVDEEADKLKSLYTKYTGKLLTNAADLKVHTDAGTLKAYKLTDPDHPGICIMLQPKGHDVEIDVTMAETDGKNINIVNWGNATTEDSTHKEILLWDDIESTLKPKVLSKEELKKVIFDEWKKFDKNTKTGNFECKLLIPSDFEKIAIYGSTNGNKYEALVEWNIKK